MYISQIQNLVLSEGQRVMLRAGLKKLRKLEADFARIDPTRHPKMLVVCEDTTVSPLVAQFLQEQEGLQPDEVMTIDSGKKAELGEKDWAPVRERLFSVDKHATPRVIVSVLMLREGFDVNNICVIVLEFLAQLPELMVFNDEAHHIHEFKREGEVTEVEWQKSLSRIAETKGRRFVQVDLSATPYNDVGSGKNKKKLYFAHIVTDFDLKAAMRAGLVKSLVLS